MESQTLDSGPLDDKLQDEGFLNRKALYKESHWVALVENSEGQWITKGPYTTQEFQSQIRHRALNVTDYCWRPGWKSWKNIFNEPVFYVSRKPPIKGVEFKRERLFDPLDIPSVEKIQGRINPEVEPLDFEDGHRLQEEDKVLKDFNDFSKLDIDFKVQSSGSEPITPHQYKGEKYKNKKAKNTSLMLHPWEPKVQDTPFVDPSDEGRSQIDSLYSNPELQQEPLKTTSPEDPSPKVSTKKPLGLFHKTMSVMFFLISLWGGGLVLTSFFGEQVKDREIWHWLLRGSAPLNFSYLTIGNYSAAQPQYLFVKTDLKEGLPLRVRFFDSQGQLIKTKKGNAGLRIPSKGRGIIRIPLYPYDFHPGSYKIAVKAENSIVEKEFLIPDERVSPE